MCSISANLEYFRQRTYPQVSIEKSIQWTPEKLAALRRLLSLAGEVDLLLDQPDCEDPAKTAWLKELEDLVKNS